MEEQWRKLFKTAIFCEGTQNTAKKIFDEHFAGLQDREARRLALAITDLAHNWPKNFVPLD